MNRRFALLAVVLLVGLLARRLWPVSGVALPPACAHRVQRGDGASVLLVCDPARADGERAGSAVGASRPMAGPALRLLGLPVDVNRASVEDLQALPGVGPTLAERIAAARPFRCSSDLQQVPGIGPKRWAEMKYAVTVDANGRRSCADHL